MRSVATSTRWGDSLTRRTLDLTTSRLRLRTLALDVLAIDAARRRPYQADAEYLAQRIDVSQHDPRPHPPQLAGLAGAAARRHWY